MNATVRTAVVLLGAVWALDAASLAERIDRLLETTPSATSTFWGIQVVDLASGKTLYETNSHHFFVPASNTKLFTTALALTRLGPGFTFQTRVLAGASPDARGRIAGDLRLVGGGDPNLSGRVIPYRKDSQSSDPLGPLDDLAAQVAAQGVTRIAGDIVGDDTWYVWQPYAVGWGIDDPASDDGPAVSALTVNDNVLTLSIHPGPRPGDLAALELSPPLEFYRLDNRLRTVAAGGERRVSFDRIPGSLDASLWGTVPLRDRGLELLLGIDDPALFAAQAFRRALEEHGVVVEGSATARHCAPENTPDLALGPSPPTEPGIELARRVSAPLLEDLRVTAKVSQNLHAELLLRAVGRARRDIGSFEAGLEEMKSFLAEAGLDPESCHFRDGSGLARLNLVTPEAVVKLLRFVYASPLREEWLSVLPVAGRDGTLATRFASGPAAGRVYAKTGSLSHVSALSGYAQRLNGDWVAFSILANNYNAGSGDIRGIIDRICNLIVE